MAQILRDALMASEQGKVLAIQVKNIPVRIREIKQLAHDSFPFHIYAVAKPKLRAIGERGGKEYDEALELIVNSRDSECDWDIAVDFLTR